MSETDSIEGPARIDDNQQKTWHVVWIVALVFNVFMFALGLLGFIRLVSAPGSGFRDSRDESSLHVSYILPHSPAEQDGLQVGDRIDAVNGTPIDNPATFSYPFGGVHTYTITRGDTTQDITVLRRPGWLSSFTSGLMATTGMLVSAAVAIGVALSLVTWLVTTGVAVQAYRKYGKNWMVYLVTLAALFIGTNFAVSHTGVSSWPGSVSHQMEGLHYVLTVALAFVAIYTLPDGRFTPAWTRWLVLVFVLMAFGNAFGPLPYVVLLVAMIVLFVLGMALLPARVKTASPERKSQLRLLNTGIVITFVFFALFALSDYVLIPTLFAEPWTAWPVLYSWGQMVETLAALALPIAVWVAVMRRKLWRESAA